MRILQWISLGAATIAAAGGSKPSKRCILDGLVQELPAPIREPVEDIRKLFLEHSYLQQAIAGEPQTFDNEEIQVFGTYLSHVSRVVKHIFLHPEGEPETDSGPAAAGASPAKADAEEAGSANEAPGRVADPSVAGPVPASCEAFGPSLKLLVILFNLPADFTQFDYERCFESGLRLSSASRDALVPLKLAEGQAQTLRWFAWMATRQRLVAAGHMPASMPLNRNEPLPPLPNAYKLGEPWRELAMDMVLAAQPILELCRQDWPKVLRAVGGASKEAFHLLQTQLEQHIDAASGAFFAACNAIADQLRQGLHEGYLSDSLIRGSYWLIEWTLRNLAGRKGFLGQSIGPRLGNCNWEQIKQFRLSVTKFVVDLAVRALKLGLLRPEVLPDHAPFETLKWDKETLDKVKERLIPVVEFRDGLQEAKVDFSRPDPLGPLQFALKGRYSSWFFLFLQAQRLLGTGDDSARALELERIELLTRVYVTFTDVLRALDQAIEDINDEPDELQRYEMIASLLLPDIPPRLNLGAEPRCGLHFPRDALMFVRLVRGKIDVPEGCEYDPEWSPLMRLVSPATASAVKRADAQPAPEAASSVLGPRVQRDRPGKEPKSKHRKLG